MKSIKLKIIILVLSGIIISSFSIGGASILHARKAVKEDSEQIMNLLCETKANKLNEVFAKVEQSVSILNVYATRQMTDLSRFMQDSDYVKAYADSLLDVSLNAALSTQGAITVYMRFDPAYTDSQSGFFYQIDSDKKHYEALTPTDLTLYQSTDIAHVGWYYEPIEKQVPVWMEPYYNDNIEEEIISYVVPIKINETFIGVVGMDISFSLLQEIVAKTSVYDSGYAFLTDQKARIVYHHDLSRGVDLTQYNDGEFQKMASILTEDSATGTGLITYSYGNTKKKAAFRSLDNGLRLVLTVPKQEIDQNANILLSQIILSLILVIIIAIIFTIIFTKRLVRPIIELNAAAKKIAAGDFEVTIKHQSQDEVGALAESFRQTTQHLQSYVLYINKLAYLDSLTGFHNKTAYLKKIKQINEEIEKGVIAFSIIVFDINDLKLINDTYGHVDGDHFITEASQIIKQSFPDGACYRIGGDEFTVLLENEQLKFLAMNLESFYENIRTSNDCSDYEYKISIAYGVANYEPSIDLNYNDVFNRADLQMYQLKEKMKKGHT